MAFKLKVPGLDGMAKKLQEEASKLDVNEMKDKLSKAANLDEVKKKVSDAVDAAGEGARSAKEKLGEIKLPMASEEKKAAEVPQSNRLGSELVFYLIMADGKLGDAELKQFDELGEATDETFAEYKEDLVQGCLDRVAAKRKDYGYLNAVNMASQAVIDQILEEEHFDYPKRKLLVWNLMAVAYCDGYGDAEKELLAFIADKLKVEKVTLQEMDNYYNTVVELDREIEWLKESDRPYKEIEPVMAEVSERRGAVLDAIHELLADEA